MVKDILRRRIISIGNHPEFLVFKILAVVAIMFGYEISYFATLSTILLVIGINLLPQRIDFILPLSDEERKYKKIGESIYFSSVYSFFLLIHNLVFVYFLKDDFTVAHAGYLLLFNLLICIFGISTGISLGSKKKKKSIPGICWEIVSCFVEGNFLFQILDLLVFKGSIYKHLKFSLMSPTWYTGTILAVILIEIINIIVNIIRLWQEDPAKYCAEIGERG